MAEVTRPLPLPDIDSKPYWDAALRHRLMMPRCRACGFLSFPPHHFCRRCTSGDLEWAEVDGRGTVYTYSIMHDTLVRGLDPPYVLAQVELDAQPGLRMVCNILECDPRDVRIGMPVEITFQDVTEDVTLPQFRPVR